VALDTHRAPVTLSRIAAHSVLFRWGPAGARGGSVWGGLGGLGPAASQITTLLLLASCALSAHSIPISMEDKSRLTD
jgi:hypothetical protein